MACLHSFTPKSHSIGALHRPPSAAGVHPPSLISIAPARHNSRTHLNLRFKKEVRGQVKQRLNHVLASNTNPSGGSNDDKTSDTAQGPPFLTILAGLIVFLLVFWIIGSIVSWLIGLIVNPPLK